MNDSAFQMMDITSLKAVLSDLRKKIVPSRIEQVQQLDPHTLQIAFRTIENLIWLEISWHAESARIVEIESPQRINGDSTLSKQIKYGAKGMTLIEIKQDGFERIVEFGIAFRPNEKVQKFLVVEIMGRHSNFIFLNEERKVISIGKQIRKNQSRLRPISTGDTYIAPPRLKGIDPSIKQSFNEWKAELSVFEISLKDSFFKTFQGISPTLLTQLAGDNEKDARKLLKKQINEVSDNEWAKLYLNWTQWLKDLETQNFLLSFKGPTAYRVWGSKDSSQDKSEDISCMLGNYYKESLQVKSLNNIIKQISSELTRKKSSEEISLEKQVYLYSNSLKINSLQTKADQILCISNPSKEQIKEAQNLYQKAKKLRRSKQILKDRIRHHKEKINFIEEIDLFLNYILKNNETTQEKLNSILNLKEDLEGYLIPNTQKTIKKKSNKKTLTGVLQIQSPSGLDIEIGRNHRQNELISIKQSRKGDIWFHSQECPGSHIVIKSSNGQATDADLQVGADLAALFSKAKENQKVSIVMVPTQKLQKIKGAAPGTITHREGQVIWGEPFNGKKYLDQSTQNA